MNKFRIVDTLNESFALNERKKENKILKDAHIKATGGRGNAPKGVYSDQEAYADNPHGSEGSMRGKKKVRGAKPSKEQQRINTRREINRRKRFIAANKAAVKAHRAELEGVAPTNESFEQAYVESQAQIALVLAESLGLISELKSAGEHSQAVRRRGGSATKAISRRTRRLKAVSAGQSDAARAAGHRAFYDARKAGMTADQAITDQETASKEQRQKERGR